MSKSCNRMDCSSLGSSVHGDSPGKKTGVGCHFLLRGSSWPRNWTRVSCTAGRFFTDWATREAPSSCPKARVRHPNGTFPLYSALSSLEQCPVLGIHFILTFFFFSHGSVVSGKKNGGWGRGALWMCFTIDTFSKKRKLTWGSMP